MGSNEEPDELETTEDSELANRMSNELNLDDFSADQSASTSSCSSSHAANLTSSHDFLVPVNYVNVEFQQVGNSGKNKAFLPVPGAEANLHSTVDTIGKHSAFEAAAAEKDLDMLLDSLGETKTLDSPGLRSNTFFPVSLGVSSVDPPEISNKELVPSKIASITANLDDALDDLLEQTSTLIKPNVSLRPQDEKSVHNIIQSSHSGNKSKLSDDFDSWFDTL
ncbi:hypothetical protein SESBI_42522 [Sesbania bispinosa]|nr:hypothetical protein SESBI_42522 [Sesbania bispinosa]